MNWIFIMSRSILRGVPQVLFEDGLGFSFLWLSNPVASSQEEHAS